jgi:hypothetical protein
LSPVSKGYRDKKKKKHLNGIALTLRMPFLYEITTIIQQDNFDQKTTITKKSKSVLWVGFARLIWIW